MDDRRRFSKKERRTAWVIQDGKCAITGEDMDENFHADHRMPWSKGGVTTIDNCDAATGRSNLKKGAGVRNRFIWQDEFIQSWQAHDRENYFLCALPGAGKTRAAMLVAKQFIDGGGCVVVVSPTRPIRREWRDEARKPITDTGRASLIDALGSFRKNIGKL